jgi:hypothetical protein
VFHCNYYNYWLQYTVLLQGSAEAQSLLVDAAHSASFALLASAGKGLDTKEEREHLARGAFSELGFGRVDLSATTDAGGRVTFPVSHYGTTFRGMSTAPSDEPSRYFDAGFATAAAEFIWNLPGGTLSPTIEACQSLGAAQGVVRLGARC